VAALAAALGDAHALAGAAAARQQQGSLARAALGFEAGAAGVVTNGRAFVGDPAGHREHLHMLLNVLAAGHAQLRLGTLHEQGAGSPATAAARERAAAAP
jgi:hypothetical protein